MNMFGTYYEVFGQVRVKDVYALFIKNKMGGECDEKLRKFWI